MKHNLKKEATALFSVIVELRIVILVNILEMIKKKTNIGNTTFLSENY